MRYLSVIFVAFGISMSAHAQTAVSLVGHLKDGIGGSGFLSTPCRVNMFSSGDSRISSFEVSREGDSNSFIVETKRFPPIQISHNGKLLGSQSLVLHGGFSQGVASYEDMFNFTLIPDEATGLPGDITISADADGMVNEVDVHFVDANEVSGTRQCVGLKPE